MYGGDSDGKVLKTYEGKFDEKYGVIDNNLISAIFKNGGGYKSEAQHAVWEYLGEWATRAGFGEIRGRVSGYGDYAIKQKFINYADKYTCDVTIFLLVNVTNSGNQNMVFARRGTPKEIDYVSVTKKWNDEDNKYGNRPEKIKVTLRYKETGEMVTKDAEGNTIENPRYLSDANNWTTTFTDLDTSFEYESIEEDIPPAYISESIGNSTKLITNTQEKIKFKIKKTWDDQKNQQSLRPGKVKVKLMRQREDKSQPAESIEEFVLKGDKWKAESKEYPTYIEGFKMKYWVEEEVPQQYRVNIEYSYSGEKLITCNVAITNNIDLIKIKITKKWIDDNNYYNTRPEKVRVYLYINKVKQENIYVDLTKDNESKDNKNLWIGELVYKDIEKLEKASKYTVGEDIPIGYTCKGSSPIKQEVGGSITSKNGFTITNRLEKINIRVHKNWDDNGNYLNSRKHPIIILWQRVNGVESRFKDTKGNYVTKTLKGNEDSGISWRANFQNLPKYIDRTEVEYFVKEEEENNTGIFEHYKLKEDPIPYTENKNGEKTFEITNKIDKIKIKVTKKWNDDKNYYNTRPEKLRIYLYIDGVKQENIYVDLTEANALPKDKNQWVGEIEYNDIEKLEDKKKYIIGEDIPPGYTCVGKNAIKQNVTGDIKNGFIITNTLERVKLIVKKTWEDNNNKEKLRKKVTVTLWQRVNGVESKYINNKGKNLTKELNTSNTTTVEFSNLPKYINRAEVEYFVKEEEGVGNNSKVLESYTPRYGDTVKNEENGNQTVEIINTLLGDSIEISGKVWVDKPDGKGNNIDNKYNSNSKDELKSGIKVKLKDKNGKEIASTETVPNGTYAIKLDNYKISDLKDAYIEFEYDGMLYTTVASATTGDNLSKADEYKTTTGKTRDEFDEAHTYVDSTVDPNNWNDLTMTATTKGIVEFEKFTSNMIKEINLGLFEREQPDVAAFIDLTQVDITKNGEKITYEYGVKGTEKDKDGMQAKFQNKDTYTYKRPVDPTVIARIQEMTDETAKNEIKVEVTYEVKVANLSATLPVTIHKIANYFDTRYTLNAEGWTVKEENGFKKAIKGDLNITLQPQSESSTIELKYTVGIDAIKGLLNNDATLNNAVEIEAFSTKYGEKTLYAGRTNAETESTKTNKPYAGYDYNSKPGNANIKLLPGTDAIQRLYPTNEKGDIILPTEMEDDTDIAPSFVLWKEKSDKTISGIVWEDENERESNEERVGNGKIDEGENRVQNVRVDLYEYKNGYSEGPKDTAYTDSNGAYTLAGFEAGKEYFVKYTYGNDISKLEHDATTMDGGETKVNARNYKSTIITESNLKNIWEIPNSELSAEQKKWASNHEEGYSVAVDYVRERLKIEDLKNKNYENPVNMIAYTKVFTYPSENEERTLKSFDFGIIERPREQLNVQKTITYFKVVLANGQILTEGNPSEDTNISYAKAIGFNSTGDKRLLIEIDSELIQGAQLEVTYEVNVTNNNEKDSDYGILDNYNDIREGTNEYISVNPEADYYYYGTNLQEENLLSAKIKYIDYLSSDIVYNLDINKWNELKNNEEIQGVYDDGYISDEVLSGLQQGKYRVLVPNGGNATGVGVSGHTIEIPRKETRSFQMTASKLLALNDNNTFYNHAEIIEIDAKTARTIKGKDENGKQIEKEYEPGNYNPTTMENTELDDDKVNITITPPTGLINNIIYIIVGFVGLIFIAITIIFIKKKVLIK